METILFVALFSFSTAIEVFPIPKSLTPPSSRRSISVAYDQNSKIKPHDRTKSIHQSNCDYTNTTQVSDF